MNNTQNIDTKRIYYLDWLRVSAFWVLIFFHSWQPFTSFEWLINKPNASIIADVLSVFFHTWRLHLIFFISGVGTWFAMKKAKSGFLKNRFKRLIIPFIVGVILIVPAQHYFEALQDQETSSNFLEFLFTYDNHLLNDHNYKFNISKWNSGLGTHVWYLTFLFTMTIVFLPALNFLNKKKVSRKVELFFNDKPNRLFLLVLPILISRLVLKPIFPSYTDFADFITYAWSFLYGFILISNHSVVLKIVQANHKKLLLLGVLSSIGLIISFTNKNLLEAGLHPNYNIYHLVVSKLIALSAFSWMFFWVSFFSKNVDKNHPILKNANESILPIYIIHQTIIVCVGYYIITLNIPSILQFLLIITVTVFLSIAYYKLVATNNISRFLMGMNKKKS